MDAEGGVMWAESAPGGLHINVSRLGREKWSSREMDMDKTMRMEETVGFGLVAASG